MKASLKELLLKLIDAVYKPPTGYGSFVDISSYTAKETAYTVPADGYIWLQCRYTTGNYIGTTVCNSDGTCERSVQIIGAGIGNTNTCVPVFKGMKAWRSGNNGSNNYIDFVPFV